MELVGWIGAAASLSAFSLNSLNIISSQSVQYLLLNIFGCFFLIVYAVFKKAHASWVLNSIWLLITVVALFKVWLVR
jgi:fluoride ion exporter CrcB/FEX